MPESPGGETIGVADGEKQCNVRGSWLLVAKAPLSKTEEGEPENSKTMAETRARLKPILWLALFAGLPFDFAQSKKVPRFHLAARTCRHCVFELVPRYI